MVLTIEIIPKMILLRNKQSKIVLPIKSIEQD